MKDKLVLFAKDLIIKIYVLVFKVPPGEFTKRLIKNLGFVFFGVGGATLITFGANILAVRYLGPVEYGKVNLIISVGELLLIPILWGFSTAVLRYLGAEKQNKEKIVGTAFQSVFLFSIIFSLLFIAFAPFLQSLFKISDDLYIFAVIYALVSAFFYLFQAFFQGLEEFKKLSLFWIISAFILVGIVVIYLFVLKDFSFRALVLGNIWRLLFIVGIGLIIFGKYLIKFDLGVFRNIFHFGTYQMLSVFAGFFSLGNIDNLMINHYLGAGAVGLYSAYYMGFNIFIGKILNGFSQVFLPMASGYQNIKEMYLRFLILARRGGVLLFFGNLLVISILFKFYGEMFEFNIWVAFLMSMSITLYVFLMILGNMIASIGIHGAKIGSILAFASAFLNVLLNIVLIPKLGVSGAIIGTIITTLVIMATAIYIIKKYFNEK